jgi:AcrR family transcriptional regulator
MDDVAGVAHISRATVYRYFAGRDDLILEVVLRRAEDFYGDLRRVVAGAPTFADGIADGIAYSVAAALRDRYLSLIFAPGDASVASGALASSPKNRGFNAAGLRPVLEAAQDRGEMRGDVGVEEVADWLLQVVLLVLTMPRDEQDEDAIRRFVLRFVAPGLVAPANQTPNR